MALLLQFYITLMVRFLHIKLAGIEILHSNGIQQSYYSITYKDRQYFTSIFSHEKANIEDDILIQLQNSIIPDSITLQRWENCMIIFNFELDISQIKSRGFIKKRIEGRQMEIINFIIHLYQEKDIVFTDKYIESVSQHYLIIQDLYNTKDKQQARAFNSPNYFTISTQNSQYTLPIRGGTVLIKLPSRIEIASFVNNVFNGKSSVINYDQLKNGLQIDINKDGKNTGKVALKMKWGINLHRFQIDQNVLIEANQLLLYDIEMKFDNITEIAGCHFKIMHGNKAFDFTEDIDHSKLTKIKKIIYFIIKSQNEEVDLILHKNGKLFTSCRINTSDLAQNSLTIVKKKWPDPTNPTKFYGYIKLRGERAKNVSIPQSNKYWRQVLKRKNTATVMMFAIQQPSVYYPSDQSLVLVAKVQNQQKSLKPLNNINFFNEQQEPSKEILQFSTKGEESVYLIVKKDVRDKDFLGIGVVNTTELRLGMNVCEVNFFKNQQKAGTVNCIINKMVFWPFVKPLFQAQSPQIPSNSQQIDIFINQITLSPFFYTFKYDNKKQVYCIVQVNKSKKVLILESTQHNELSLTTAPGSDFLNYFVDQPEVIKIKLTFLVSDLGHEQEIYGISNCRIRGQDLNQKDVKLKNIEICNDYSINLGYISLEISKTAVPKVTPKPIATTEPQKKSVGSFDLSQASFDTQLNNLKNSPSRRYSGGYINNSKPIIRDFLKKNTAPKPVKEIKLPVIKERKDKDSFKGLFQLMKVRKRGHGGYFEQNANEKKSQQKQIKKQRQSFDLKRIQQLNPNLDRNLQILFPKKTNQKQIQQSRSKQNTYDQRLRGLKSVMNQMSDVGQIEPSIRQSYNDRDYNEQNYQAEWQGNQFIQ